MMMKTWWYQNAGIGRQDSGNVMVLYSRQRSMVAYHQLQLFALTCCNQAIGKPMRARDYDGGGMPRVRGSVQGCQSLDRSR